MPVYVGQPPLQQTDWMNRNVTQNQVVKCSSPIHCIEIRRQVPQRMGVVVPADQTLLAVEPGHLTQVFPAERDITEHSDLVIGPDHLVPPFDEVLVVCLDRRELPSLGQYALMAEMQIRDDEFVSHNLRFGRTRHHFLFQIGNALQQVGYGVIEIRRHFALQTLESIFQKVDLIFEISVRMFSIHRECLPNSKKWQRRSELNAHTPLQRRLH